MQGTAFKDRQWLIERSGQFIQVTELLYRIAEHADGERTLDDIAAAVTAATDWAVEADHVWHVVQTKLMPLGLVTGADGAVTSLRKERTRSPLALNMRLSLVGPRLLDPLTKVLQVFYAPPVLIPLLFAIALAHWWLYFVHGVVEGLRAALYTPGALSVVLAIMVLAGVFHELGHAAALRYGGGKARGIGAGLYLVWPVFYTDATDSYRLGRWARVRTDLGGLYFHLIFALGVIAAFLASGQEFLLFFVLLIDLAIIFECLPFVRLDGYWTLADLTGIPDLFSQMGPFLASVAPVRGWQGSKLPPLKVWARAVFAVYVIATVPVLALLFLLMVRGVPYLITTVWDALLDQTHVLAGAWSAGQVLVLAASATQLVLLALPVLGTAFALYSVGRRLMAGIWTWSRPTPARRSAGALATAGAVGLVALLWAPGLRQLSLKWAPAPDGIQSYTVTEADHVLTPVAYAQTPPVGGNHAPIWQNCGFYAAPVADEHAVHSMEHGAVWVTYRPDLPADQVDALRRLAQGQTYVLVSPYPDLPAPVVASAWGHQLRLQTVEDPALAQFVSLFRQGRQAPERGGPCTGGTGAPA